MRYTEETDPSVLEIPAGQVWVGIIAAPTPHIVITTRLEDDTDVIVARFNASDAMDMAAELARLANALEAQKN
jgi:nicotinamide mononucleotide (NMN) deamidase PncC